MFICVLNSHLNTVLSVWGTFFLRKAFHGGTTFQSKFIGGWKGGGGLHGGLMIASRKGKGILGNLFFNNLNTIKLKVLAKHNGKAKTYP